MLGLIWYLIMILLPLLIPVGVTVAHPVGEWRHGRRSAVPTTRHAPAVASPR
ncbi:MAG: hypothetical protein QOH91_920 [Mycobacterium sp.]|jgi:hypothetical protein|nr:hypothetical protein [Mycobacterium sp.]